MAESCTSGSGVSTFYWILSLQYVCQDREECHRSNSLVTLSLFRSNSWITLKVFRSHLYSSCLSIFQAPVLIIFYTKFSCSGGCGFWTNTVLSHDDRQVRTQQNIISHPPPCALYLIQMKSPFEQ